MSTKAHHRDLLWTKKPSVQIENIICLRLILIFSSHLNLNLISGVYFPTEILHAPFLLI